MTSRASDSPARTLPIPVRPFPLETVGSYVRRLAVANQVPFGDLLGYLAHDQTPERSSLVRSYELMLNQPAAERLATIGGTSITRLGRALPGLTGRPDSRPLRSWQVIGPVRRPVRACARCAALRGSDEILLYQPLHHPLCLRHASWLAGRDDNREIDLARLPAVVQAARRHSRLTRHRDPLALKTAYRQANQIAQDWFDRTSFLTHVWHERYDQIGASRPHGARVITYPETVGLTSLLSSLSWTSQLCRGDYYTAIPAFLREAGRRIGHPYPDKPGNDPLRYWAFRQWAGEPTRVLLSIDW
jgi:hypothetical protein